MARARGSGRGPSRRWTLQDLEQARGLPGASGLVERELDPESVVQSQILEYLAFEPRVACAWRMNSGAMLIEAAEGSAARYVKFNTAEGMSDIAGVLDDGRALFIEVKAEGWRAPSARAQGEAAVRYRRQRSFIGQMRAAGAAAGFASSIQHAAAIIKNGEFPSEKAYQWFDPNRNFGDQHSGHDGRESGG